MINTVTGAIKINELGRTLMHEHFFFGYPGIQGDMSMEHIGKEEIIEKCAEEAKAIVAQGYNTVIDATPNDCCRNPEWLREISEKSGLQIVCCTGFYNTDICGKGYWAIRSIISDAVKELSELFIHEYTREIHNTGIRAGVVKVSTSLGDEISDYEKMFFKAAAIAQKETDCVIITHTSDGTGAPAQAKLLLECGADPEKVVLGHMDNYIVPDDLIKIMDLGYYVGLDRCGQTWNSPTDEIRLQVLKDLLARGYEDQIVMSQDNIVIFMGRRFSWPEEIKSAFGEDFNMRHIADKYIAMMKDAGVTDKQINKFFIDNPRKIFG